jgi:hypothetical protein
MCQCLRLEYLLKLHYNEFMYSEENTLDVNTPLVFKDGTELYDEFAKRYITHKRGFFILAPSGAGKTYYINNQKTKHWIDGDEIWIAANAHPKFGWWLQSDVVTMQAKMLGFWIMGASNNWLKPDAVVLPHLITHKKYIRSRENNEYDGGATSDKMAQVLNHRKIIENWVKKGVPKFDSIEKAVTYLASLKESKGG